jgi:hypothetical protein
MSHHTSTVHWIPIAERLPEDDRSVMIHNAANEPATWIGWYEEEEGTWYEVSGSRIEVALWAEIPSPRP